MPVSRHHLIAHRRARSVALGSALRLQFEDAWTVHHQVQEVLRIERVRDAHAAAREAGTWAHLLPDGTLGCAHPAHPAQPLQCALAPALAAAWRSDLAVPR